MKSILLAVLFAAFALVDLQAAFTIKNGRFVDADLVPTMSVEEHYDTAVAAYSEENWREATRHFTIVTTAFPLSAYAQEAAFYLAVGYYQLGEYDFANTMLTEYLQGKNHPRLFMEAIEYKLAIAEQFRFGARCRLLGSKYLPKWGAGESTALSIYDEIIAAVPCHDLSARALYCKAMLHSSRREFRDSVDCLQMGVKRFPKHELCPEYYLMINKVYLDQCSYEFQNPDLLAFAEINFKRFQMQFPREERLADAADDLLAIKEVYGAGLAETGFFYERIGRPNAAILYYQHAIKQFPETKAANSALGRLKALGAVCISQSNGQDDSGKKELKKFNDEEEEKEEIDDVEEASTLNFENAKIDWIP